LTKCGDLSEVEAEETETAVVAVKTAETAEALETAAVTIMTVVLTIKAAATLVMTTAAAAVTALIEAAVTERAAAVYRRGRWFVSSVSDVRIMWNITPPLKYDSAQWMRTCSSTKSDAVSEMYSSQDMRKACPCALSPSK
jgi:hypothetical protein